MRNMILLVAALWLAGCANPPGLYRAPPQLEFIEGAQPAYPAEAREQRVEGVVVLAYDVTTEGTVQNVRVVSAEPAGIFDAAAIAAVRTWKYRPLRIGGELQTAEGVQSTLRFRLGEAWQGF